MTRTSVTLSLVLAAMLSAAGSAQAKIKVVTTVQTFKSFAEEVGGDKVEVSALVGDAVDPHFVEAKPSYAVLLNKADLLVYVGLELEKGWLPPLLEQSRNPAIQAGQPGNLDASTTGIVIEDLGLNTSRSQGDIHPLGNPHYWLPPDNALFVARAVKDRLKLIDAPNAKYYEERYSAFRQAMKARRVKWEEAARALGGVKIVTYHRSWDYLLAWLGIVEIGNVEPKPGIPPDPSHLSQLVRDARAQGAKMVIVESFYARNTAQRVAELGGMKLVVLDSDATSGQSYFTLIDKLIAQLTSAL